MFASIVDRYEAGQTLPWCYTLNQSEIKEMISPLLGKGRHEPSRYIVMMFLPGKVDPDVDKPAKPIPVKKKPSLKPIEI